MEETPYEEECIMHEAVNKVMGRLSWPLELSIKVRNKIGTLSEEDIRNFVDFSLPYLADKYVTNNTEAMLMVMNKLGNGIV